MAGSISKILETLDYFGYSYKEPVYTHGKKVEFPKCCLINAKELKRLTSWFFLRF